MSSNTSQYAAYFEEFDEDANDILPDTRTVANVAAKRSKPDIQTAGTSTDGASDSGYSSRTAATVGSADSLPTGKRSPNFAQLDAIANRELERARGRPDNREKENPKTKAKDKESRESNLKPSHSNGAPAQAKMRSASRPAPKRSSSKSRKWDLSNGRNASGACFCPECDQQDYSNMGMGHSSDHHPMDYSTYMNPQPHVYDIPPSPQSFYQPMGAHEVVSSRRERPTPYHPNRPLSFHGGMPDMSNMYPQMTPSSAYEHGPPLSASAYAHYPAPYMSGGPVITHPNQMSYDSAPPPSLERPRPRAVSTSRSPEKISGRRASMYGTPVVEYAPSPSNHSDALQRKSSRARRPSQPQPPSYDPDEDYYRQMPPPPLPKSRPTQVILSQPSRPTPRKAVTTNNTPTMKRRSQAAFDVEELRQSLPPVQVPTRQGREKSRDRMPLERRPSARGKSSVRTASYHDSSRDTRVSVESSRRRRSSVYGLEQSRDLDQLQREVEEYQARTSKPVPLTLDTLVKSRRADHRADSDSGSLRTGTDSSRGSDSRTKSGAGRTDDDNVTVLVIDGVTIGIPKGSRDRRTINFTSGDDGERIELNIGGGRRESQYIASRSDTLSSGRREIEDVRRLRHESSSDRASRRSSRSGYSGRGLLE
ncbi:hypothetical protein AJ79_07109 [Helicocarpus griseus UAMH5409]|uniref:Uncharacterized protein n=1 Tax=Helicocarpus griseus UAMH5409 TaxID=1447875 RepID=A0A2B7X615_9EURO|nr:hypothetical protein AJ79_07109 [Helicocarpus griseus UAMH5409]